MKSLYIKSNIQNETLTGSILQSTNFHFPRFIFLHGAGQSSKEKIFNIAKPIVESGTNILSFDFSGHGESTGLLKKSSLKKRVNEATSMINQFASKESLIICGASMGGYIAIKMLEHHLVDTLILLCPAIYDAKAFSISFDEGFTDIIRDPASWCNTDVLATLEKYNGKLLIIIGEEDEVIPPGIIDLIVQHTPQAKQKEVYRIPKCPHQINAWLSQNEMELKQVQNKIMKYL